MNAHGVVAARLHLKYIERDGVEQDGSQGRLYGDELDREALTKSLPDERHQFRFIISPEDAHEIDLGDFTRQLMTDVQADLGRRLIWGAVNHYNTDNPHVHLIVRGIDADGDRVRIDPDYITHGMRWRAQHVMTRELGPRCEIEVGQQLAREVRLERPTSLDRAIEAALGFDRTVDLADLSDTTGPRTRACIVARLDVLEEYGLAAHTTPKSWQLADGWQDALRSLGERAEAMNRIDMALGGAGDRTRFRVVDGLSELEPIDGIVRRKGLHDEMRGDLYAVVESPRGHAYHVRLDPAQANVIAEGALVRVSVQRDTWAKATDRVIEQVADENGGVYDPRSHLESLRAKPISIGGRSVTAEAVVDVNVRRLERLERHQLVSHLEDGTWRVPPDLVALLQEREATHPRLRTSVEVVAPSLTDQIQQRGEMWLDSQSAADETRARRGFGAEISAAVRQRAAFLRSLEIELPALDAALAIDTNERDALGRQLAVESALTYLPEAPAGFRGRLLPCEPTPSGQIFAAIVDERTRRMTVVPDGPNMRELAGRVVELAADAEGHLRVRPLGLSRGL